MDVVVEGRMGTDGTFHATTLLAKCASRYENAPDDKYKQTPGYKAAERDARDPHWRAVALGRAAHGGLVDDGVVRRRRARAATI